MTRRESTSTRSIQGSRFDRTLLLLAAVCIAFMPSVYKGGSEIPHPHSFFQFWLSGPVTAFAHHQYVESDSTPEGSHGHSSTHQGGSIAPQDAEIGSAQRSIEIDKDMLTVSPATVPGGIVSMLIVLTLLAAAMASPFASTWKYADWNRMMTGRFPAPEPPPPRNNFNV